MSNQDKTGTVRVVAAVADKNQVVLYKEDGDTVILLQGDHRLSDLLDEIIPITSRGEVAVVNLDKFSVYADFENQSRGVVRFFKVARKKLAAMTGFKPNQETVIVNMEFTPDITPQQMSGLLDQVEAHILPYIEEKEPQPGMLMAVDVKTTQGDTVTETTIVERLEPMGDSDDVHPEDSVVAIIGDIMIPDIEKLKPYIQHSIKTNSTEAVVNFLKRVAVIIGKRAHSAIDLMRFLENADLPLADDGSIIAYKILKSTSDAGIYVDCHTKKIRQKVGSYVHVDEKLVDPNRHNECSNGLHIARRGYLGGFLGDVCVLCKIAPEDVMVVPHGDANKVRVKGYHILGLVSEKNFNLLRDNKPITEDDEARLDVLSAIRGEHVEKLEEVKINGQYGSGIVVTQFVEQKKAKNKSQASSKDSKRAAAFDDKENIVGAVEPKSINQRVNEEVRKNASKVGNSEPSKKANRPSLVSKSNGKSLKNKGKSTNKNAIKKTNTPVNKSSSKPAKVMQINGNSSPEELSPEQKEALDLVASGVSQSEASRRTNVSRRTIGRLVDKFGT